MSARPKVLVVACGGTISTEVRTEGAEPSLRGIDLIAAAPGVEDHADLHVEQFSQLLSSEFTAEGVYHLARRVKERLDADSALAGVVVLQGTSVMEESAFMADLLVDDDRPVVFTGAMRPPGPSSDGPVNLVNAVRIAVSPHARSKGVLLAMNGAIHAARNAVKGHTTDVNAFESGEFGSLGYAYPDRIHFASQPLLRANVFTERPVFDIELIKFVVGMGPRLVRASIDGGAAAIVMEGSGVGNLNSEVAVAVKEALARGLVVALSSRTGRGRTYGLYGTPAGSQTLIGAGCLPSSLPGPKTRILLMLALGTSISREQLRVLLDPLESQGA